MRTIAALVRRAAEVFDTTPSDILGSSRLRRHSEPRHVVCYLARARLGMSYSAIGRRLSGRDHSTIRWACETVGRRSHDDPLYMELIEAVWDDQ